eukprot:571532-Hanusia_phi.AAC.2
MGVVGMSSAPPPPAPAPGVTNKPLGRVFYYSGFNFSISHVFNTDGIPQQVSQRPGVTSQRGSFQENQESSPCIRTTCTPESVQASPGCVCQVVGPLIRFHDDADSAQCPTVAGHPAGRSARH